MFLILLILLPSLIFADEAYDLATDFENKVTLAQTREQAWALHTDPFEYDVCGTFNRTTHLDEKFAEETEQQLKAKKQPEYVEAIAKRQMTYWKLDSASKTLEYSVHFPTHNVTISYRAQLHGQNYKISWIQYCENVWE